MSDVVKDFRGTPIRVRQLVAYAGRKPSQGLGPRGKATLVLCRVRAIDPTVRLDANEGMGPKVTLDVVEAKHTRVTVLTTRDMDKLAVIGE